MSHIRISSQVSHVREHLINVTCKKSNEISLDGGSGRVAKLTDW